MTTNLASLTTAEDIIAYLQGYAKPENASKKVIVGMSGGVDSSVSAYILQLQGYQVEGVFMKNWEEDDGTEYCTAAADLADAQAVADALGMKLHKINFAAEYWDLVFENFLQEYSAGRTPNPDILCNREIKFKAFLDYAIEDLGADYIATGHYCRRSANNELLRGLDNNKDQSYFLYTLHKDILAKVFFPVGELTKPQVRLLAEHLGLQTAKKKDSTGICFIGERRFQDFLSTYLPAREGKIVNHSTGEVLGTHPGVMYFTIGQRKGLGIGGIKGHNDLGWFVVEKDVENNILYVVDSPEDPRLFSKQITVKQLHLGSKPQITQEYVDELNKLNLTAKVRYRSPDVPVRVALVSQQPANQSASTQAALVQPTPATLYNEPVSQTTLSANTNGNGDQTNNYLVVVFEEGQSAVTPGQSLVLYAGEVCLGGGIIDENLVKLG